MGPSWYWMPMYLKDILIALEKKFLIIMNWKDLILHTGFIGKMEQMDIPADYDELKKLFETIELEAEQAR